ncbi:long-chain-fatty-acid--CoA ligase [Iodidimonas sp. SYSU 1G8]|uniref:long-chain-fatty-acid--CoA ligase n=1 Tax=Iodidimonas sp. SYSU 1G8 TaxID=3133967 RepID=UPI0031FE936E
MMGLMQQRPLLISSLLEHAELNHGETEIVSCPVESGEHRYTYADCAKRTRMLAKLLLSLGVEPGDRIGTLAWNTWRHFELFYAIPGIAAVCHTINPRLFEEQISYIVNHAEDRFLFIDLTFVELVERLIDDLPSVEAVVIMTDAAHMPATTLSNALCYEDLLAGQNDAFEWPLFDENTASSLCYTSGTTGDPKGVLYAHRSTILHTYAASLPDVHAFSAHDCILPVAPMFHANSWGIPYCAAAVGAKLVLPGRDVSGARIHELMLKEGVTHSAAVPTIWLDLLNQIESSGKGVGQLNRVCIGGTAPPRSMIARFHKLGVQVRQGWGMTEMSPMGTFATLKRDMLDWPEERKLDVLVKQGRGAYGVQMRIVDDEGRVLPRDGKTFGLLQVRGPWVTSGYFRRQDSPIDADGWFDTGDVATIDPHGFMQITDRAKDVIKSGGEWISSIELENAAMGHPGVAEAAVIGAAHPKWDERPLLVVVPKGAPPDKHELIEYLSAHVAKWWLPDDVVFVDELPHTATGKVQKTALRDRFRDYTLPTA